MDDCKNIISSVSRSLKRRGRAATYNKVTMGDYNVDTGKRDEVITSTDLTAIVSKFTPSEMVETAIEMDDIKITLGSFSNVDKGDRILIGAIEYSVLWYKETYCKDTILKVVIQGRE